MNYYNEIDPFCLQWLQNLMSAGLIPQGVLDARSIADVQPSDLQGFNQCHFFAGIAGWSLALQIASWPPDLPVWTGSCPCQPFSTIGKGHGFSDPRHLWPEWFRLISHLQPPVIFGEQVASALPWVDLVFSDLESSDYSCGAADLPAASVGTRHQRQRLWFVAHSNQTRRPDSQGLSAPQAILDSRTTSGVVPGLSPWNLPGSLEPTKDWIVDGLSGEGLATSALGNSIVPQVAAEFISAFREALMDLA